MSAKPWEKWTAEEIRKAIESGNQTLLQSVAYAFAALKEAEQRGERCVLPPEVEDEEMDTMKGFNGGWCAWKSGEYMPEGRGKTQQAAVEDLARKIKEGM